MFSGRLARGICIGLALVGAVAIGARAAEKDPIKDAELTLSGNAYLLSDEAQVLDDMKSLRQTKKQVDDDARERRMYQARLTNAKNFLRDSHKEYDSLEERLAVVRDPEVHNRIVARINTLVVRAREAAESQQEMEDKIAKVGGPAEAQFVDALIPLEEKAQSVSEKYATLAKDADLKVAIAKAGPKGRAHPSLGPSSEFAKAVEDLKKWRSQVESESIPLLGKDGIQTVKVLLNGEPHQMVLDTGGSAVTLPGDLAEQLKLVPGPQDPLVQVKIANGSTMEGHMMALKTVRVGRFTVDNVSCIVLDKGLADAPAILGNTFLSHFVVKLDQQAGKLELTEISDNKPSAKGTASEGHGTKRPSGPENSN